jgi:dimethylargininase
VDSAARALERYRPLAGIEAPATLDGGDVLVTPGRVFVGISGRTNAGGARRLAAILAPHGIDVVPVAVTGCLHLKSAVTAIPPEGDGLPPEGGSYGSTSVASAFRRKPALLLNPDWVDPAIFAGFDLVEVDPSEPYAANVLAVCGQVICAEAHTHTRRRLDARGIATTTVPAGELAKAEGGVTCGAIIFPAGT